MSSFERFLKENYEITMEQYKNLSDENKSIIDRTWEATIGW